MSWNTFKGMMKPYMDNPNGVKSKEAFAKQFTLAYDTAIRTGSVSIRGFGGFPLPVSKGNTETMESLMIAACAIAQTKTESGQHTWLKDIGMAVKGYWTGVQLTPIPPSIPPIGAFQNVALNSGTAMGTGVWPQTPPETPSNTTDTFLNLFVIYAISHLASINFSVVTTSLYFGFPLIPPLPGVVQAKGYTLPQ